MAGEQAEPELAAAGVNSADVSREHARIRRDQQTGRFFLIDLSSLGTTLNGRHVPRGYDDVDGTKRENGVETPLPDQARIGLAETNLANATCGTIRLKLLKIGARVRISVRRIKIAMASACPAAEQWACAARRLAQAAKARASPA